MQETIDSIRALISGMSSIDISKLIDGMKPIVREAAISVGLTPHDINPMIVISSHGIKKGKIAGWLGKEDFGTEELHINPKALLRGSDYIRFMLLHELAHAMTGERHGSKFELLLRKLGVPGIYRD